MSENIELLKSIPLFQNIEADVLFDVSKNMVINEYDKNEYVFPSGIICNKIHIVKSGSFKGGVYSDDGQELNSQRYHPGDVFGLFTLFDPEAQLFFYQAIEDSTLISINSDYFNTLLKTNALLCHQVLQLVGEIMLLSIDKRIDLVFFNNKIQILKFIAQLSTKYGKKIGAELLVKHDMTHQDMANFLGCSRQSISTIMSELKKEDIITAITSNSFLIKDRALLDQKINSF